MVSIFVRRKKKESSPNDVDDNSKSKDYIDITDMSDKEKYVEISRKIDNLEKLVLANKSIQKELEPDTKTQTKKPKTVETKSKKPDNYDQTGIEIVTIKGEGEIEKVEFEDQKQKIPEEITDGDTTYLKKGFGWKGLGARRISYDEEIKEYKYELIEPILSKEEIEIKDQLVYFFRVRADIDVFDLDEKKKLENLELALEKIIYENHIKIEDEAKDYIFYYVFREFVGFGKIDILMHDGGIEDISCDGQGIPIFIYHKDFESIRSNIIFDNGDELDSFVVKLAQMCGKQISVFEPIVDGKLEDGSRLQCTLSRTITRYSTFTIRRFREDPLTPIDLIENNTFSIEMAAYFWIAMEKGTSILFCGGTASGKTTALNALSLFLPSTFKIVSIEDTREINLPHENWIAGTTRSGFASTEEHKTSKDIDMFDLIRVALRQRPKVIIVGEVRGKEAYTLFQAMTTGHLSYSTIHASNMHTLIQRLENKPIDLPRALLTSLDIIVFLNSVTVEANPARRITNVTEVIKLDPESNRLVTLTPFRWISEINDKFEYTGGSRILHQVQMENGWDDNRLKQEIENRKKILKYMMKNNLRSYKDVGGIVAEYGKDSEGLMKKVNEDMK